MPIPVKMDRIAEGELRIWSEAGLTIVPEQCPIEASRQNWLGHPAGIPKV